MKIDERKEDDNENPNSLINLGNHLLKYIFIYIYKKKKKKKKKKI